MTIKNFTLNFTPSKVACASHLSPSGEQTGLSRPKCRGVRFYIDMRGFTFNNCNTNYVYANYQAATGIDNMGTAIYFYGANTTTHLKCNKWVTCKQGIYEDGTTLGNQGAANDTWENEWNAFGTNYRVDGVNAAPVYWYIKGAIINNKYSPDPFINVPLIIIPNGTQPNADFCSEPAMDGSDSIHIANVVGGAIQYSEFEASNGYTDSINAILTLSRDSNLRNSNIDFLNFYNDAMNNSIGDFITVLNFVDDVEYSAAQTKLNIIDCSSQIELNLKDVLSIFINSKINNEDYSIQDIETLQNIAYQIPKEGGPAVYLARAILNSEMDDANGTGRFGNNQTALPNYYFELSPNPAKDLVTIVNYKIDKFFQIEIMDLYGKVVLSKTFDGNLQQHQLNISELKSAIYFVLIKDKNRTVASKKLAILR